MRTLDRRLTIRVYRDGRIVVATSRWDQSHWEIIDSWVFKSWNQVLVIVRRILDHPLAWSIHVRYQGVDVMRGGTE